MRRVPRVVPALALLFLSAALVPASAEARHRHDFRHPHHHHRHHDRHGGLSFGVGLAIGAFSHALWAPRPVYAYRPVYVAPRPVHVAGPYVAGPYPGAAWGSIETDVKPSSAAVYLDGRAVGIADDFDGWPAKLPVEAGTHELVFREHGYRPLRVTVEVLPRHSVEVEQRLERGLDDPSAAAAAPAPGWEEGSGGDGSVARPPRGGGDRARAPSGEGGTLRLEVSPAEARVYVDGRLERGGDGAGYRLDLAPGLHRVEVVAPGFDRFTGEVFVREGQRQELSVRLSPSGADGA